MTIIVPPTQIRVFLISVHNVLLAIDTDIDSMEFHYQRVSISVNTSIQFHKRHFLFGHIMGLSLGQCGQTFREIKITSKQKNAEFSGIPENNTFSTHYSLCKMIYISDFIDLGCF